MNAHERAAWALYCAETAGACDVRDFWHELSHSMQSHYLARCAVAASLPQDAAARKAAPMAEGLLYYFPNALAEVARVSKAGNDQHNPGQPMHHARGKSMDHADCIIRHLVDAGTVDSDGQRHSAKVAWRALALLQEELEREEGCPLARNAMEPVQMGGCAPPVYASGMAADRLNSRRLTAGSIEAIPPMQSTRAMTPEERAAIRPQNAHPMAAESIREQDERLAWMEARL